MEPPRFDMRLFGDDYLYFMADVLTDEVTEAGVESVWRLLELEPGLDVLDLGCGHGRIANRLAERGARVTGIDATPSFLDMARADAAARGVEVEYLEGDMRSSSPGSRAPSPNLPQGSPVTPCGERIGPGVTCP